MNDEYEVELGELTEDDTDLVDDVPANDTSEPIAEDDPTFDIPEPETPKRCRTCGNPLTAVSNVDGECPYCAIKRIRRMERRLVEIKQLKNERTYCTIEGHREVTKTPLFPDWDGKISINGVDLYPVYPLCKNCIDQLTAYLVFYLEERGIMRKGSGNAKNIFGDPLNTPLTMVESKEAQRKLEAFLSSVTLFALDDKSPVNRVYTQLRDRRRAILSARVKEAKKCLNENKLKSKQEQASQDAKILLNAGRENLPPKMDDNWISRLQGQTTDIVRELVEQDAEENPETSMKMLWTPYQQIPLPERLQDAEVESKFNLFKSIVIARIPYLKDLAVTFVDSVLEGALDYVLCR